MKKCKCCCDDALNLGSYDICNLPETIELTGTKDRAAYELTMCWSDQMYVHPDKVTDSGTGKVIFTFREIICNFANSLHCYKIMLVDCETGEKLCYEFDLFRGC